MIAKLKGRVDSTGEDWVVLDVNGVGYLVFCASRTLTRLPAPGEAAVLFIETNVREDHIHLYGFLSDAERALFRLLTGVQGVGPKAGLSILSVGEPDHLIQAIAAQDKAVFTRAAGVGPKLAARIVAELREKVAGLAFALPAVKATPGAPGAGAGAGLAVAPSSDAIEEAISALVNLGYGRVDALAAAARAAQSLGEKATVQTILSAALRDLGKGLTA